MSNKKDFAVLVDTRLWTNTSFAVNVAGATEAIKRIAKIMMKIKAAKHFVEKNTFKDMRIDFELHKNNLTPSLVIFKAQLVNWFHTLYNSVN